MNIPAATLQKHVQLAANGQELRQPALVCVSCFIVA